MKKKLLTKKLIIAAISWLLVISAGAAAYVWLTDQIEFYESETVNKNSSYEANLTKQESIAKNIKQSEDAEKLYDTYAVSTTNDKDEYRKNSLVRALSDITNELQTIKVAFKKGEADKYPPIPSIDGVEVTYSTVSVDFDALTDIAAFEILGLLQQKLAGKVYVKEFSIEKIKDIDSSILLEISNGKVPYLVKGKIKFDWIQVLVEPLPTISEQPADVQNPEQVAPIDSNMPVAPNQQGVPPFAPEINAGGQGV